MPLPEPKIIGVQGVCELKEIGRDQARDDLFIAAVRREFPHVQNRQVIGPEAPLQTPHLILASQSAQLTLSAVVAELQIQFYGEYVSDVPKALDYAERKIRAVYDALHKVEVPTATFGAIARLHYPHADDDDITAPQRVQQTLTNFEVDADDLEDAQVKVALRVAGTYFVHVTVENYEIRKFEQPVQVGMLLPAQPWRGTTEETGIEIAVDVNNKWERRREQRETEVDLDGVAATLGLIKHLALVAGPKFAETGELSVSELASVTQTGAN